MQSRIKPSFSFEIIVVDLVIVPGLAFTTNRGRLGRGKGFYDRYLAGIRRFYKEFHPNLEPPHTLALAFSEQMCDDILIEEHDMKIDAVLYA